MKRNALLAHVAQKIAALAKAGRLFVAIDGVDGSGKTTFANELAHFLALCSLPVLRASVDGFHNPRAVRYRLGRESPHGYFVDSFDYASLHQHLLHPLRHGCAMAQTARFDHALDQVIDTAWCEAAPNSVLILDGIFLHRDELFKLWDYSVFLDVPWRVSFARMASRDGSPEDPLHERNRRYLEGQKLYLDRCRPKERASVVIDNTRLDAPDIVTATVTALPPSPTPPARR